VISATLTGIAAYHYFRIFDSFRHAFTTDAAGGRGTYTQAAGESFNEGYRYVDWLLTVPLLLEPGSEAVVTLRHEDLAAWVGCNREAVSRALSRLKSQGLVTTGRGRIVLLDARGLRALAD
jgi:CRP-like cAMP-binding protein